MTKINRIQKSVLAVVFNGGRGYRLSEITKGEVPKGFLIFNKLPLISYQINALFSTGINNFLIIVSTQNDKEIFENFITQQLVPAALYTILVIEYKREGTYSSPYLYFKNKTFLEQTGAHDLLTVNSDNIFKARDIRKVIATGQKNDVTVVTLYDKPACKNPFFISKNKVVSQKAAMFTEDSDITGITFYPQTIINILKQGLNVPEPHIHKAIKLLRDHGHEVRVQELSYFVNMNTVHQYNEVVSFISQNPNW